VLRIRATVVDQIRRFFNDNGYVLIDTPIFAPAAGEGSQTLFKVDYFGEQVYLAQTGQLYLEAACMAHGNVYCFGPTFRAEKSKTRRHLTEFWMVEPEIAFVTKTALKGPGCHIGTVLAATDFVMPAIEIIDSRYRDFKFDLKSVIADNCSSSRFVVGGRMRPVADLDLRTIGVVLEKNGEVVALGAGAAVLGHPAAAIAMLANLLGERGEEIPAGSLILSGAITEAVMVKAGDNVSLQMQGMGSVNVRFV
jgi:2-keto-4-pentenoate hydratase